MIKSEQTGTRMVYLIKRRKETSREELIAHWFANHMPGVIERNRRNKETNKLHANQYVATLFNPKNNELQVWDGMALLWYSTRPPRQAQASAIEPYDTFQEMVEPYWPWATKEYVTIDGTLSLQPLSLNPPFPCTRSDFFKVTYLVALKKGLDRNKFFAHWLQQHAPNVQRTMDEVGGFRYTIGHSLEPETEPYTGMAELYFPDKGSWEAYNSALKADGFEQWVDFQKTLCFQSSTEMIGIE